MREGWKEVKLGEIVKIKHGYAFKGEYFSDSATKNLLLTPGNFAIGGGFKSDKFKYYEGPLPSEYLLKGGDIIVTMTDLSKMGDTIGYSAKIPNNHDYTYLHNQRLGLVDVFNVLYDSEFIYWLLRSEKYQKYIAGSSVGATVKHTSPNKIYGYKCFLPTSIESQQKIASILSVYDDLIENNLKRIELLEELAQQTYEEWFVRMRFPGYETEVVDGETGLPEGWGVKLLKEVSSINSKSIKKSFEGFIEYIDIASVSTKNIDYTTNYEINLAPGRAKRIVKHKDIIWSCVRPNRKSYAMIWNPEVNTIASTGFCVISPESVPATYLYQHLTTDSFVAKLTSLAGGAAYPAVKTEDFANSEIILPTNILLQQYNKIFEPSFDVINNLKIQNQHLKETRDILLPRLMIGIIEV